MWNLAIVSVNYEKAYFTFSYTLVVLHREHYTIERKHKFKDIVMCNKIYGYDNICSKSD